MISILTEHEQFGHLRVSDCSFTIIVGQEIDLVAYIINQHICLKNNTTQLHLVVSKEVGYPNASIRR